MLQCQTKNVRRLSLEKEGESRHGWCGSAWPCASTDHDEAAEEEEDLCAPVPHFSTDKEQLEMHSLAQV
jgi:hypothetical protein